MSSPHSSMEQLLLVLNVPPTVQPFIPLHSNPVWYKPFGALPLTPIETKLIWHQQNDERFRLNPNVERQVPIEVQTPLLLPQTIKGTLEAYSGDVLLSSQPITIKVDTSPFTIVEQKEGRTTHIQILIDNRNQNKHRTHIELNLNKGRSTPWAELYTVTVPEDDVAVYGFEYLVSVDYESMTGRYKNYRSEAQ